MIVEPNTPMAHRKFVSDEETAEVNYWVKAFETNPSELRRAIKTVGTSVKEVRAHLEQATAKLRR